MSTHTKLVIPILIIFVGYIAYLLIATQDIGLFGNIRSSGEINQSVNLYVVSEKGFQRNSNNQIITFYVKDREGDEAVVNLKEPAPEEIINAKIVELFGHMHGNEFVGVRAKPVKDSGY